MWYSQLNLPGILRVHCSSVFKKVSVSFSVPLNGFIMAAWAWPMRQRASGTVLNVQRPWEDEGGNRIASKYWNDWMGCLDQGIHSRIFSQPVSPNLFYSGTVKKETILSDGFCAHRKCPPARKHLICGWLQLKHTPWNIYLMKLW